jgi:segregation and condensation protein B
VDIQEAKSVIENILFVSGGPVSADKFVELFGGELSRDQIGEIIGDIAREYESLALAVVEVAEGWRMQTRPEYAAWITQFFKMEKGQKLGRAAMESLAIISYRQPITRAEIDEIRGVDSGGAIRSLVDKNMVRPMGRRKAPGKPMMYGTTKRFLEYFGLAGLSDLPTLDEFRKELDEVFGERSPQQSLEFAAGDPAPASTVSETDESPDGDGMDEEEGGVTEDGIAIIQRGFEPDEDEPREPREEMGEGDEIEDGEMSGVDALTEDAPRKEGVAGTGISSPEDNEKTR